MTRNAWLWTQASIAVIAAAAASIRQQVRVAAVNAPPAARQ